VIGKYNDALISNDFWTGKIIEKVKELGRYEETLVYNACQIWFRP